MPSGSAGRGAVAFALSLVYLIWGSIYLAIRLVIEEVPPLGSMGARFLLAALLMAVFLAVRGGWRRLLVTRREVGGAAFLGVLLLACGNGLTSVGQLHGVPSGVTALLVAMVPVWICIYRAVSGDRPRALEPAGVGVGLVGLAVLVLPTGSERSSLPLVGVAVIVLSSLSWSFGSWIKPRLWLPQDVYVGATYQLLAAGAAMMLASVVTRERFGGEIGLRAWGAFGYLVIFGSVVGFTAYAWLLHHAPLSLVATHTYVNPVVAVALGSVVLSEPVTPALVVGGVVVLMSVVLVVSAQARPRRVRTADRSGEAAMVRD
ncbi:Permease of the drug/metabolite transporter (DMT) superfamily [Rhodococcus rhodochrous J3]|uniref:Drug/metabolite transporter (DMT)-like permease n=2 Tax=Rhodococcus rhodochrous TaxID=1829 RepID=A0A562E2P1_RHORH|nr:EamA family transporter [Rhodococcus rhodochrous]MBF4478164.1 EamA family transporter [Rhodococcus rhodochrous]MCB8913845.1 EamA family transporter [Rhodococcus rhodochrous]MCD2099783.1 EamA family transporter [Rhodococcus rhodochrous]MCD2124077.1 EamA family transporter [Rhodococcus rhodochrous]MCQ4136838.1 EamA family transporter [Rhodococcus rhodochrous]